MGWYGMAEQLDRSIPGAVRGSRLLTPRARYFIGSSGADFNIACTQPDYNTANQSSLHRYYGIREALGEHLKMHRKSGPSKTTSIIVCNFPEASSHSPVIRLTVKDVFAK